LKKRSATVADEARSILAVEHEILQSPVRQDYYAANVVCPFEHPVPVGAIVRHVSKTFIFQYLQIVLNGVVALEGNAR
jgi:hypothetical protein